MQQRRHWQYRGINNWTMTTMALMPSRRRRYHGRRITTLTDATRWWRVDNILLRVGSIYFMLYQLFGHDGRRTVVLLLFEGGR